MTHLIDKDHVVSEIERRIKQFVNENNTLLKNSDNAKELRSRIIMCKEILSFIDTLEVKETDYRPIDNDFERDAVSFCIDTGLNTTPYIAKTIAKHFFELGLKSQKGE